MGRYSGKSMPELKAAIQNVDPGAWQHGSDTWAAMAGGLEATLTDLNEAWDQTPVFHSNEPGKSAAFDGFNANVRATHLSVADWVLFGKGVAGGLANTAHAIRVVRPGVEQSYDQWVIADQAQQRAQAAGDEARVAVERIRKAFLEAGAKSLMDILARKMEQTFVGVDLPEKPFQGPMRPGDAPTGTGDPGTGAPAGDVGAGGPVGGGPGGDGLGGDGLGGDGLGGDGLGGGDVPGSAGPGAAPAAPAAPNAPETKDPLDQATKIVDLIGKGIDLAGRPADVAGKYLGLVEQLKGLLGAENAGGLDPEELIPDDLIPDDLTEGPSSDQPTLAGGATGTVPALDPSAFGPPGAGGGPTPASPVVGPAMGAGAVGNAGAEPSLAGKGSSAPTGRAGSTPAMFPPPMGGMGAAAGAGAGGRGEVRPGTATARPGFAVPPAQSETERLSRHGVQSDLQGRTSGEQRAPSAVPRRRRRSTPTEGRTGQDVLDEELWRL